nr:odorant receptor 82 [Graphosoma rubrolineatum]
MADWELDDTLQTRSYDHLTDKCRACTVISIVSSPTMLTVYYAFYHMRIKRFFELSDELSERILNSELSQTENFRRNYLSVAKSNNSLTKIALTFIFWTPILYNLPTPLIDLYNQEYRKTHPVYLLYPFDVHKPGTYEITFILLTLGLLCGDMKKFASDCFFLTTFRTQIVYLKFLSASIRDLGQEFKKKEDFILKKKLIKWIELHNHFIRNFSELISLYTPVICIYYANLMSTVVLLLFTQLQEEKNGLIESLGLAGFVSANVFQLYMQCATNDDFSVEADNLALGIYNTPWHEVEKKNKVMILIMLIVASKPVEITAFKSPTLRLNKEAFLSFVASTITAVMSFKKMSDLQRD